MSDEASDRSGTTTVEVLERDRCNSGAGTGRVARCSRAWPDPNVRRAEPTESRAVADVWLRSRHASVPAIPAPVHPDEEVRQWFRDVVLPTRDVWVAVEPTDRIIAVMVLEPGWLDQLHVDPPWFGQGLGSALVDRAKHEQPAGLDLWVFASNTGARRFYERHDFVAIAGTDGDNEEGEPDVRYRWRPET